MRHGIWLAVVCLLLGGCVRRSLTIRTVPPGANVYINDVLEGVSPVSYDFMWYGWHRVSIRKDGYERVDDRKWLRAPAYLWIPLDLAMELVPFPIRDERTWSYTLLPEQVPPSPVPPVIPAAPSTPSETAPAPPAPAPAAPVIDAATQGPTMEPTDELR